MTRHLRQAYNGYMPLILVGYSSDKEFDQRLQPDLQKGSISRLNSAVATAVMLNKSSISMVVLEDDSNLCVRDSCFDQFRFSVLNFNSKAAMGGDASSAPKYLYF